jgi:hypothetical protein
MIEAVAAAAAPFGARSMWVVTISDHQAWFADGRHEVKP